LTEWHSQLEFLRQKLDGRDIAHFKSGEGNTCLDGTREALRCRIGGWIDTQQRNDQEKVFWLHGKAGSGKSTVANTVAAMVQQQGYLLSCFFCKRDDSYLSNPKKILCALAYRFAEQHDSYRIALMKFFHEGTDGVGIAETTDITTQLERLFTKLLPSITDPCRPHVVVIDALDECGSPKERRELVQAVLRLSSMTPWIKVFLTSRGEAEIHKVVSEASNQCIVRDINREDQADQDIERYIVSQSDELELQLSKDETRLLVQRADGLFIWCRTLFTYLTDHADPRGALDDFRCGDLEKGAFSPLYALYHQVLESAAKSPQDMVSMRAVLATISVVSVNRPLSTTAIWSNLKDSEDGQLRVRSAEQVKSLVKRLHAVLYSEGAEDSAVRAYHASFYDFLDEQILTTADWPRANDIHLQMLRRSLDIMRKELRFNICKLGSPVLNKDVADLERRIQANISEGLSYSSMFWFIHLLPSHSAKEDIHRSVCELFSTERLLFWLECLSLQGFLDPRILQLERVGGIFKVRNQSACRSPLR
jgi:tRNA A37 threonylcarbamoyladenosine biosynthesis protein TsaE